MSDHLDIALRELGDLDPDGLGARRAPAAELRARGERHRRRRYAVTTVASAAIVAVVAVGLNVLTDSGPSQVTPAPSPDTTESTAPTTAPTGPAVDEPTPDPTAPAVQLVVPDDFPLAASYPETNEDTTPVKVTRRPGVGGLTLCGETILDSAGASAVAGTKYVGAEDYRARTLLLFESSADAIAVVQHAELVVRQCPEFDNSTFTPVEVPLGEKSFGFDVAYDAAQGGFALGLSSYLVVQVGQAVLIGSAYGESTFPNPEFDKALADDARDVVAAMADARWAG